MKSSLTQQSMIETTYRTPQRRVQSSLSIIVPLFNEEESVPQLRDRLGPVIDRLRTMYDIQLILVDDGSIDATPELLERCFPPESADRLLILRHERNRGIAAAMRTGFHAATGQFVCTLDADCTYDPAELILMLERLEEERADVVTASPYHPAALTPEVSKRLLLSRVCSLFYRALIPEKLYCYTCFFRVMRQEWANSEMFTDDGFLGVTEHLLAAAWCGATIVEHPATLGTRRYGRSKMRTVRVIRDHLGLMTRTLTLRARLALGRVGGLAGGYMVDEPIYALAGDTDDQLGRLEYLGSYRLDPSLARKLVRTLEVGQQARAV